MERVLELRVHGVSNTPPNQLLGLHPAPGGDGPQPWRVAGGDVTGFYRSTTAGRDDPISVEAYSWGQLTSGARTARDVERALWTLLLPFTLANVALFARTGIPADPDQERWGSRSGIVAWLIRLFCLSLTGTLVITLTGVGVDLIAWQCVGPDCLSHLPGPWEWLGDTWWRRDTRALTVGLLLPLLILLALGGLAWRTYQYEAEMPADPRPRPGNRDDRPATEPPEPWENPLQDPTFWCGEGQLRRAAVLHLCTGAVAAAAVPVSAVIIMDPPRGTRAAVAWPTVVLLAAVVAIAVVAVARPWLSRRQGATPLGRWSATVAVLAGLGLVGTFALLLLPDGPAGRPLAEFRPPVGCAHDPGIPGCRADRSLPGYDTAVAWLATYQVLLLIAIGAVNRSGRRALLAPAAGAALLPFGVVWIERGLPAVPPAPAGLDIWALVVPAVAVAVTGLLLPRTRPAVAEQPLGAHTDLAWGGRGPALIAGFGWMMAVAYCAGLLYWFSDRLNSRGTPSESFRVVPPLAVFWAGLACVVGLLALLGLLVRAGFLFRSLRRTEHATLAAAAGLSAHDLRRCRDVSTFRALHRLVGEHAIRLIGCHAAVSTGLVTLCCAAALSRSRPSPQSPAGWPAVVHRAADLGDMLLGLLPVVVGVIGLFVYRNDTVRRSVGVIWDVGTFWPRAAHPLAPPSYAERAVPELQTRVAGLLALTPHHPDRMDGVILSGHSQGTVICAATLLQLPRHWRRRIWFFSYGCQLTRLYGRVFPAYFGPDRLRALARALTWPGGYVAWTNFWRDTDPLGWPVNAGERDVPVADPEALHPSGGEVADPPIRSHSNYPEALEFTRERAVVARLLRRAVPSPRQGVD
ncbi:MULTISPECIES: hypothetical protein [Micromonospora]|uniref:Integral membrane protein n=1 Tax=Micromonospora solifontis TaxID=2487138 RepID=A0ABX9WL07_9ACTN|nr:MULTISPECIES: hypothetical protein [Micromonospora]NES15348.1 hypothetical protein [Micromonospora sp. PPF5-17B]NES36139.1 hypothetical protein [Micromonospora solifontis]NES56696.1 hypothetical protein [Micromonospora sp. PPF5-6]RNL99892.1 hypothetical protein EFE23_08165 [Micromonospora solifontis]